MKLKTLAFIAASSAMTLPVFAADYDIAEFDTLFGTGISNTASLKYQVNGTDIDETSNTVAFKVDRKVIFSVTDNQTATDPVVVNAGDDAVTVYTIQNDSNAPISFKLPVPPAGTTYSYLNPTNTIMTVDSTDAAAIIPLATGNANTPVTIEITVTLTVPNNAESADQVFTPLKIVAVEPVDNADIGGGVTAGDPIIATPSTVAWDNNVIQTITIGDLLNADGVSVELNNTQEFIVAASNIALVKSVAILSDPVNGTTNPKAIPGAVVEYTLTITNAGLIAATGVVLSNAVPAVFNLGDTYNETYTLNGTDIALSVTTAVDGTTSITTVTFPATDIAGATDITNASTYGEAVIKFTVTLP
ncbi:MAG: putative repeat protein (TIGR01451 family) [Oleispira sp.]|jgi:uncharacterized repeat protein (TIGR01451 family)